MLVSLIIAIQYSINSYIINFCIVALITFLIITLISSYLKFQEITNNLDENDDYSEQDILRLNLAKILSESIRKKNSFFVAQIRIVKSKEQNINNYEITNYLKTYLRNEDKIINFKNHIFLIIRCEQNEYKDILFRIIVRISEFNSMLTQDKVFIGVSCFPLHGLNTEDLLEEASNALKQTNDNKKIIFNNSEENKNDEETEETEETEEKLLNPITGVLNEKTLSKFVQREISELRLKRKPCIILCLKIKNISDIIELHNQDIANKFLRIISDIIQNIIRDNDIVGSYDENNFMILLHTDLSKAGVIAKRILHETQNKKFNIDSKKLNPNIIIGISAYPEHGNNLLILYKKAKNALTYCNENDIRGYLIYNKKIDKNLKQRRYKFYEIRCKY